MGTKLWWFVWLMFKLTVSTEYYIEILGLWLQLNIGHLKLGYILSNSGHLLQEQAVRARQLAEQLMERIKESQKGRKVWYYVNDANDITKLLLLRHPIDQHRAWICVGKDTKLLTGHGTLNARQKMTSSVVNVFLIFFNQLQMYQPSALIVGAHGKSSLKSMFPGNNISQFCLRNAPVPVIVVKEANSLSRYSGSNSSSEETTNGNKNYTFTASNWIRRLSLTNRTPK